MTAADVERPVNPMGSSAVSSYWEIGQRVLANASFDGKPHAAEVLHRRCIGNQMQYYVHYTKYDKRLDEWVNGDNISVYTAGIDDVEDGLSSPKTAGWALTTRRSKRKFNEFCGGNGVNTSEKEHHGHHEKEIKVKNIESIELGEHEMDTWYYSPYPDEYGQVRKLYVCEWCLKYMRKRKTLLKHLEVCSLRGPPGDLVYEHPHRPGIADLCMFEVNGARNKLYAQNLCLLGKLFLDHKTLYFDVQHFLFYVLTERSESGYHIVGYFSKEKRSADNYNLACIVTLPPFQRRGYGTFLIDFSYLLSRAECKHGTPERPLSDLGQVSYRLYWQRVILQYLSTCAADFVTLDDISNALCFRHQDAKDAMEQLGMLRYHRGMHYIERCQRTIEEKLSHYRFDTRLQLDPGRLDWVPWASRSEESKPCGGWEA